MDIAIGVVSHNKRGDQAAELMHTVGAVYRSVDNGRRGCDQNHRRVWDRLARYNTDWTLCLEDDAAPVDGFTDQLEQALAHSPCDVVSLYLGTSRPVWYQPCGQRSARKLQPLITEAITKAEQQDASYITSPKLFHAVAVAIRTHLVPSMLDYVSASKKPIDYAISDWCEAEGHTIAYCVPSICDHRDEPSVITRHPDGQPRNKPRIAHRHGTRDTWTTKAVTL